MSWIVVRYKFKWAGPAEGFVKKPRSEVYWDGEKNWVGNRGGAKAYKWPHIARLVARALFAEVSTQEMVEIEKK